ncbi:MAG: cytochrome c biogenesis protein [Betaproteobacteria bacterium]
MQFGLGTYGISLAAGSLSTLSPCVLPLVPILLASAVTAHRLGPWALAAGLTLSFTVVGVALASAGASLGLDPNTFRTAAAVLLIVFGVLLLSAKLQERFAAATSGLSAAGHGLLARVTLGGLPGQFVLGVLLGIVWSPCVGPTLGAAVTLASQGEELAQVTLVMALFGFGASLPLVLLGLASRGAMTRLRGRLLAAGRGGKKVLGTVMLVLGAFILTGIDKRVEAWLLDVAPPWITQIGTSL